MNEDKVIKIESRFEMNNQGFNEDTMRQHAIDRCYDDLMLQGMQSGCIEVKENNRGGSIEITMGVYMLSADMIHSLKDMIDKGNMFDVQDFFNTNIVYKRASRY